ncbi:MAG TPA: tetratricopeptide repeat protein [Candidatus Acidoferrum sp.]|nr:tetratricopeptide repeat protein [Candidatus Acidoferrum sp.]
MILRLSSAAARGLLVLFALVLAAYYFYSGVRYALAAHDLGSNTLSGLAGASRLEPDNATNWYLLGRYWQYNLENPDTKRAIQDYKKAASLNPHSPDIWMDLAAALESEGQINDAEKAFLAAKQAYPLSPEVSWRYGNFLLRQGTLDAAFAQIKNAVAVDPKRAPAALALARRLIPDFGAALDRVVPSSTTAYLHIINSLSDQRETDRALQVWDKLADIHPRFVLSDSFELIGELVQERKISEAGRIWNQSLGFAGISTAPGPRGSLIWDGGFETDISGGGFAWRFPYAFPGGQLNLDTSVKHSGKRSLRLTFNGNYNADLENLCELVAVHPDSSYRFSGWVRTDSLTTDQGVRFGLTPLGRAAYPVVWTNEIHGTNPWTNVELQWKSASDVNGLQICISRQPSSGFDNKISGSAWIDDVTLFPETGENIHP